MTAANWSVRRAAQPAGFPEKLALSGPLLRAMVRELMSDLAHSVHDGDDRAMTRADYETAVSRLADGDHRDAEYLRDRVADAWDALEPELCSDVYLTPGQAVALADAIYAAVGQRTTSRRAA